MPYYFNLPVITDLTIHQQAALDEEEPLALSGGPGTGKSVVCLYRHIRNHEAGLKNSLLLTYTKTLEYYLKQTAEERNEDAGKRVSRTYKWLNKSKTQYEEIIIDEGQDVSIKNYKDLKRYTNEVSYGADNAQSLYEAGCTPEELSDLFPNNEEYTLQKNFRNSKEILEFTKSVFSEILIPQTTINDARKTGLKPILKEVGWTNFNEKEVDEIIKIINRFAKDTHNIGILVPTKNWVEKYYDMIKKTLDDNQDFSKYHNKMPSFQTLSNVHITTFKSAKGIEFDTVIIPSFNSFNFFIDKDFPITRKDYYVAFTRTKTNLFLLCKSNPKIGNRSTYEIE
jgi:DNA helicase IV